MAGSITRFALGWLVFDDGPTEGLAGEEYDRYTGVLSRRGIREIFNFSLILMMDLWGSRLLCRALGRGKMDGTRLIFDRRLVKEP